MPGIHKNDEEVQRTTSAGNDIAVPSDEQPNESSEEGSDRPARELTQTDRLNKILLNSFLQRMNNEASGQGPSEQPDNADEANDWEWSERVFMIGLKNKYENCVAENQINRKTIIDNYIWFVSSFVSFKCV